MIDQQTAGARVATAFSAELWSGIEDVYAAILDHPFLAGLTDGSLERGAFELYVVQDAHYLREYARALSIAAARAPSEADIAMFNDHAAGAIAVERSLHEAFFADFGLTEDEVASTPMAPQRRVHELPARDRLRRLVRRPARGRPAVLLGLLGGRQRD